jgi:tetratricopeptide (TPR) repeat protein
VAAASGALLLARRRRPDARALYLLAVASTIGAAHFLMAEPTLGYARDWDLFAPSGALVSVAAISGLVAILPRSIAARGVFALLVLSVWTTGAWVAVNASETRSAQRFAHVPLGLGRTEVVLGNWHWRNARPLEARRWLEFALRRNPLNNNAHALLAAMSAEAGDFRDARERMAEAVRLRPRKIEYHAALLEFCDRDGAARAAIAELERWLVIHASDPDAWLDLAQRQSALEGMEAAQPALLRAVELYESRWNEGTHDAALAIRIGDLRAGRAEKEIALEWYRRALELDPGADGARRRLIAVEAESPQP